MSLNYGFAYPALTPQGVDGTNPFGQYGLTLDCFFSGSPAQYTIWGTNVGLVSKTFSQIITFTRASTGTFVGSNGLIQSAAVDTPRFDYSPTTLAARGLLVEESSTNLHLYSQDFSTGWTNANTTDATLTAAAAAGLDGTTSAGSLLCSTTTDAGRRVYASANITVTASTVYTSSCYVKPVNGWQWISFSCTSGTAFTTGFSKVFDLTNGTLGTNGAATASITPAGNGWFRIVITGSSSSTGYRPKISLLDADEAVNGTAVGVVGAGVLVWGMQLEQKDFSTSYIPTTTTSLTRSADSALINTLSPWFNATEGTLYAEATYPVIAASATANRLGAALSDGSVNNRVNLGRSGGVDNARSVVTSGGVGQNSANGQQITGVFAVSNTAKLATAYATDNITFAANGTTAAATPPNALPVGINLLSIGNRYDTNAGTSINGHIQRITYYPRRLSDAELQTITT